MASAASRLARRWVGTPTLRTWQLTTARDAKASVERAVAAKKLRGCVHPPYELLYPASKGREAHRQVVASLQAALRQGDRKRELRLYGSLAGRDGQQHNKAESGQCAGGNDCVVTSARRETTCECWAMILRQGVAVPFRPILNHNPSRRFASSADNGARASGLRTIT